MKIHGRNFSREEKGDQGRTSQVRRTVYVGFSPKSAAVIIKILCAVQSAGEEDWSVVDSGAGDNVLLVDALQFIPISITSKSKPGRGFAGAGGEWIANHLEQSL